MSRQPPKYGLAIYLLAFIALAGTLAYLYLEGGF